MPVSITATPTPLPVAASPQHLVGAWTESGCRRSRAGAVSIRLRARSASRRVERDRAHAVAGWRGAFASAGASSGGEAVDHVQVAGHAAAGRAHQLARARAGSTPASNCTMASTGLAGLRCRPASPARGSRRRQGRRGRVRRWRARRRSPRGRGRRTTASTRSTTLNALKPQRMRSGRAGSSSLSGSTSVSRSELRPSCLEGDRDLLLCVSASRRVCRGVPASRYVASMREPEPSRNLNRPVSTYV